MYTSPNHVLDEPRASCESERNTCAFSIQIRRARLNNVFDASSVGKRYCGCSRS